MTRTCLAVVLCVGLAAPSLAAEPIRFDAALAALQAAAPAPKPPRRNDELYWGGVVMSALGGYLFGSGLGMGPHQVTCTGFGSFASCSETGGNRGMFLGIGAAVMGSGRVMAAVGGKRVTVAPSLTGAQVSVRF